MATRPLRSPRSRPSAVLLLVGALLAALAGCSDDPTAPARRTPGAEGPVLVVFVPGFMSEFYEATTAYVEEELCDELRGRARALNFSLPGVGTVPLGDRVAAALPCLDVLPDDGFVSFATQRAYLDAEGVEYHSLTDEADFNSEESVEHNAAAIARYLATVEGRRVLLVSHSKGGLDALHALITHPELRNDPVVGWVALQPPFAGSPIADVMPDRLAALALDALGGSGKALDDLQVSSRSQYLQDHAAAIADLTAGIPVQICSSSYTAPTPLDQVLDGIGGQVFSSGFLADAVDIAKAKIAAYPFDFARALSEAVSEIVDLVRSRARSAAASRLARLGMMDNTNRAMNALGMDNDGLVPVDSARLAGAHAVTLAPEADHAAPVMITAPLKQFWTTDHRNTRTLELVDETLALTGGAPREGAE